MVRLSGICIAVALLAAACGPPGPKTYDEAKVRACITAEHLHVGPPPTSDFVASTALDGAFRVTFNNTAVTMAFGSNPDNAQGLEQAYSNVHAANVGIADVLRIQGNAVMLWQSHPSDAQVNQILGCLK